MPSKSIFNIPTTITSLTFLGTAFAIIYDVSFNEGMGLQGLISPVYRPAFYVLGAFSGAWVSRFSKLGGDSAAANNCLHLAWLIGRGGSGWGLPEYFIVLTILLAYTGATRTLIFLMKQWLGYDMADNEGTSIIAIIGIVILCWFIIWPILAIDS